MAWENNHIIRLTNFQRLDNEALVNVYHYELQQDSVAADILQAFEDQVMDVVKTIQSSSLVHTKLLIEDIDAAGAQAEVTINPEEAGARAGEYLPTYAAWGFKLVRSTNATRHGQKRIAGVAEGDIQGNVASSSFVATLNTCAAALGAVVTWSGGTKSMTPVIFREAAGAEPRAVNIVQSGQYTRPTTQNSRKKY